MPRISSFKAQYRQSPTRAATPPPPAYEPLSPVLHPSESSTLPPASGDQSDSTYHKRPFNGSERILPPLRESNRTSLHLSAAAGPSEPSLRSAPLPQPRAHFSMPLGSPIEALADVAMTSNQTHPNYGQIQQHASHPGPTHASIPQAIPTSERTPLNSHLGHTLHIREPASYSYNDRPAKRARSEFYGSPPYGQTQSRPATSHIPGWSYNVEQMVDNRMRMYQDGRGPPPQQAEGSGDMLSDAQLLLNFFNVSSHTAQTPPSTAKRWSVSHSATSEQKFYHAQHTIEPQASFPSAHPSVVQYSQHVQDAPQIKQPSDAPLPPPVIPETIPAAQTQTQTPPEEKGSLVTEQETSNTMSTVVEEVKPKKHQGWPKGKPRGPRSNASTNKRKKSTPKPKNAASASTAVAADQLKSPQSLIADRLIAEATTEPIPVSAPQEMTVTPVHPGHARRHSFSNSSQELLNIPSQAVYARSRSVPLESHPPLPQSATVLPHPPPPPPPSRKPAVEQPDLICAACKSSESEVKVGDGEQWIGCDGCKEWHHYACAGFNSEREVRDVNKFYCEPCRPKFGETTKVRKSVRAHTTVDYAGLNEGVLKTSDDNPEHHYIAAFKNGDIEFTPETFARLPPELISGDWFEKTNGFKEPVLIPGALNPRPGTPSVEKEESADDDMSTLFEYETVQDDDQDKLDMVIPRGLTVRRVAELYGSNEPVPVIDVKAQEGEGKKWTMGKWADYYEQQGEKPVRNVISLEVSRSRLGRLIRRPKGVREMDLQDSVWREDDKAPPPPVQFYCLMSVADCFTDFHIDFGGSSVYYHIVKGKKVFFFIPPTKQNLKKYEDWCLSPNQGHDWLGKQVKECYRVDLYPGDTMLIPSGWIHAVWTPEDSLVIGGNFLTRIHYGMQIKVLEIEKNTKVALQFRYPFFQKIMWLTAIKYLEEDPLPEVVQHLLQSGNQFQRSVPIYCQSDRFGHNSMAGVANYNRRYYSKHELEGLSELLDYIWRTVLIVTEKIEVPQRTRNAVNKSIPKGFGEPLVLARRFAMWIAWKRGNETIPAWAFSDALISSEALEAEERKSTAVQSRKTSRETPTDVVRAMSERASARVKTTEPVVEGMTEPSPIAESDVMHPFDTTPVPFGALTGFLRPSASNPHITTPKTSQLGPKRVACDACRKRRIRCKHKDELIDTSKPGMHTIDLSGSYGISVKRRLSDHSIADGQGNSSNGPVNGGPIMADVNGDPYALKSGRVKACADCRKSKRRCIHDEYGNVDPIKANEVPIPRGSASKKRRVSDEPMIGGAKRMKHEAYDEDFVNGDMQSHHSLPGHFGSRSSFLQDLAYSAQQALDQNPTDDLVPVDPSLHAYTNNDYQPMDIAPTYHHNGDSVLTSIEHQNGDSGPMVGIELIVRSHEPHGPSVEPLTPGPPPASETMQLQIDPELSLSMDEQPSSYQHAVRRPSSPISPRAGPAISSTTPSHNSNATSPTTTAYNNLTANSDYPPPPVTPTTISLRPIDGPSSSNRKSHTPSRGGRASKTPKSAPRDSVKVEPPFDKALLGAIDPNLDQASIDLIKQLQQEDLGLRRRSR